MRKYLLILLCFLLVGCSENDPKVPETLQELIDSITIANNLTEDINLPEVYNLKGTDVYALWESNNAALTSEGVVKRGLADINVTLTLSLVTSSELLTKNFDIIILAQDRNVYLAKALETLTIPTQTKVNLSLVKYASYNSNSFNITWSTSNNEVLTNTGRVGLIANDTNITLTASIFYETTTVTKDFPIKIIALSAEEKAEFVFNNADIPLVTSNNVVLPTGFAFGLTGTWESSKPEVLSNSGLLSININQTTNVTLTLTLSTGQRRTFEVIVNQNNHLLLDRTFNGEKIDVKLENKKLVLVDTALTGTYTTEVYTTHKFVEAVASWAAVTSKTATCELFIKIRVDGVWSKYFSYGVWGQGLNNEAINDNDTIAKLSTDEVIVLNSKKADALQMQIVLKRNTLSDDSPVVSLLAVALNIPDYSYQVDVTNLRTSVNYDIPKLYQHDVPGIGKIICSATSSTMLLNYKGHSFVGLADYEHQYIAGIVKDYGHNIYGNWVYNTVGMSSFGEISYVKRMYSYQELVESLDRVGPVSASIKGTFVGTNGEAYTTDGHLIVVRGYRFENGQLYILVNDPNLKQVAVEMTVENFMKVWRNVVYIVE
jgi:hypothetical protein